MRSAPLYALLFSLIAPTVAPSIVGAEEHGGKLTLQEAERLALSDSPSLRSATDVVGNGGLAENSSDRRSGEKPDIVGGSSGYAIP